MIMASGIKMMKTLRSRFLGFFRKKRQRERLHLLLGPPELLRHLVRELDATSSLDAAPHALGKADLEHQVVDLDDEEDGDGGEADVQGEPARSLSRMTFL